MIKVGSQKPQPLVFCPGCSKLMLPWTVQEHTEC